MSILLVRRSLGGGGTAVGPVLEIVREFVVRHDVNRLEVLNGSEVVEKQFDDRFPADLEQRFGFVQGEGIKPCRVTGSENQCVHRIFGTIIRRLPCASYSEKRLSSRSGQNGRAQMVLQPGD